VKNLRLSVFRRIYTLAFYVKLTFKRSSLKGIVMIVTFLLG